MAICVHYKRIDRINTNFSSHGKAIFPSHKAALNCISRWQSLRWLYAPYLIEQVEANTEDWHPDVTHYHEAA